MMIKKMALYSLAGMGVLYTGLSFMSFNASGNQKIVYIDKPIYKEVVKYVSVGATLDNDQIDTLITYLNKFYPDDYNRVINFYAGITGNKDVAETILKYCIKYHTPINLTFGMIRQESNFNPRAYNQNPSSIDRGLCMLNSKAFPTWRWRDFYNMDENAKAGISYFGYLLDRYKDNDLQDELALSAYNEGISTIESDVIHFTTSIHVFKVKDFENQYTHEFNVEVLPEIDSSKIYRQNS